MATIYIASDVDLAGKTSLAVTLGRRFEQKGKKVALFKPFYRQGSRYQEDYDRQIFLDAVRFSQDAQSQWPIELNPEQALSDDNLSGAVAAFGEVSNGMDVTIVEGVSGIDGNVGEASLKTAEKFDASTVVVIGYRPDMGVEEAVMAKSLFGDRLVGVVLNGITKYKMNSVKTNLVENIKAQGIRVLATIPEDRRLLGVNVGQLASHLGGEFLSWEDKSDNLVEHLLVGGMVLDSGIHYFERFSNKAVIVRGDRPDLQFAALQTPTSCIVLTGGHMPIQYIFHESRETEIPLIKIEQDTLSAADALSSIQEYSKFDHPLKQDKFLSLLEEFGDWASLEALVGSV